MFHDLDRIGHILFLPIFLSPANKGHVHSMYWPKPNVLISLSISGLLTLLSFSILRLIQLQESFSNLLFSFSFLIEKSTIKIEFEIPASRSSQVVGRNRTFLHCFPITAPIVKA
jgi:hypothetical protein